MSSKEIYYQFFIESFRADENPYMKYDSLESEKDLVALFEVLFSLRDKNGDHSYRFIKHYTG